MNGHGNRSSGVGVLGVARCVCFTSQAGRSCLAPGGPWERQRIRRSRNRCRPGKKSAGLIVPSGSPWKLGEREGALLQSAVLEGVWDVRLPHGYQRSSTSPETAESPIPHIQAGEEEKVSLNLSLFVEGRSGL